MSNFPTILYKCPGVHAGPLGKTFKTAQAADQSALDALIADGWHATLPAACGIVSAPVAVEPEPEADLLAPPTRDELEAKANELGIKFDGRTRDGKLATMIADALKVI